MPGPESTYRLHHHSHHLLSFGTGQPEKQCGPGECLPSGQGGVYYKKTARTHEKKGRNILQPTSQNLAMRSKLFGALDLLSQ